MAQHNLPPDIILEHTRNLPAQYLLNTPLEEMYLHIAMIGRLRETFEPAIDFKHEYGADYTEMMLCAYDDPRPGLLAKITGVLYAHDVNLHTAQVFTREASVRIAIDTLWVDYRGKPLSTHKRAEVQESLRRVLLGEIGVGELLQTHKKPLKEQTIYAAKIDDERLGALQPAGSQRARRDRRRLPPGPRRLRPGLEHPRRPPFRLGQPRPRCVLHHRPGRRESPRCRLSPACCPPCRRLGESAMQ